MNNPYVYRCCSYDDYVDYQEEKIDGASDFFQGVLDHLYGDKPLDVDNLEHCIEEMCSLLGNKFPKNNLTIKRAND